MTMNNLTNLYLQQSVEFDKHLLTMTVNECGEQMIPLKKFFSSQNISVVFDKSLDTDSNTKKLFFLRKSVAIAVGEAAKEFVQHGMILKIEDTYRSLLVQKMKFLKEVDILQKKYPKLSLEEIKKEVNMYIAGIPILAAHTAGAAIDVVLLHKDSLKPVNFGSGHTKFDETSITDYSDLPDEAKDNRVFLKKIMEKHGLINYPFQYWHFSMGDVCAAYTVGLSQAIYAPIMIDHNSGKIISSVASEDLKSYF